jgi:hypothetical protein
MAKKRVTLIDRLEKAAGDVADAVSVAATGSQVGVLELAAEDELGVRTPRRRRKKTVANKKAVTRRAAARKHAVTKKRVAKKAARRTAKKSKARSKPR